MSLELLLLLTLSCQMETGFVQLAHTDPLIHDADHLKLLTSKDQLRATYRNLLQLSSPRKKTPEGQIVPAMTKLYHQLATTELLPHKERTQYRERLKSRLEQMRDKLLREQLANSKTRKREQFRRTGVVTKQALAGPEEDRAAELIALIQTTIEPDHWDINGGQGSIRYFPGLHLLVVRASQDVHYQIGGAIGH